MAELWASTEAIWRDMFLAEALVLFLIFIFITVHLNECVRRV